MNIYNILNMDITLLHKRNEIDSLSKKEREELLDKLINFDINLSRKEVQFLNKKQLEKYTNKRFQKLAWITPEEWKQSDETQKELYSYNMNRSWFTQELFDSMDKEWRKNVLMAVNVLSGYFLNKDRFDKLSDDEKRYYANKKLIKTSDMYPHEIKYLKLQNLKNLIDTVIFSNGANDFTKEQLENFSKPALSYYEKQKEKFFNLQEQKLRKTIRNIISEQFKNV
jgi:hypothetical protein